MARIGYFLSCEEFGPRELVRQARMAEQAGFDALWISDHYHPWVDAQGNSPFVWSVIGALSEATSLPITTAVTCPTVRIHPAVIAQAAATAAVQTRGRFVLGVGSGEALNEHVLGDRWPPAPVRLEMLEEAIEVIRTLHRGGRVTHHGRYYTVEDARMYTLPDEPVPIYVSGFGPLAARHAGRLGDGFCTALPQADLIRTFRDNGGGDKPVQAGMKVCWADSEEAGLEQAHQLWASEQLPGQLNQELPTPRHFEQAVSLVTEDMVRSAFPCGPDVDEHVAGVRAFLDAGADEVYVQQIGPHQDEFFAAWSAEVLPRLR
ncbi:F420-dependent oxidoreductase, G6PDH family [Amycolatopsis arida]|uniref:F420-dependent oxidoreductase, G6PDH family n=1 Tax=Amycolatopsis arida TaxID=587909 RepID=A0A1I5KPC4_9PSEU|nr:TIGR03557 family F420-dependent LLM class oxidoreductase [Amycolatopsis arida]TDX97141.1 G6PDH family F420-dependent oxidoreductase [Amycolatopsis arida]SFO86848.1 F420-dependent oxidoreductase, G6PDH family [Amycolatopsis arida]